MSDNQPHWETLEERIAAKPALAAKPAYISRCRKCGGMTGCCSDDREDKSMAAQFARDAILGGDIVERGIAADVWSATWCDCNEPPQAGLFDKESDQDRPKPKVPPPVTSRPQNTPG